MTKEEREYFFDLVDKGGMYYIEWSGKIMGFLREMFPMTGIIVKRRLRMALTKRHES